LAKKKCDKNVAICVTATPTAHSQSSDLKNQNFKQV